MVRVREVWCGERNGVGDWRKCMEHVSRRSGAERERERESWRPGQDLQGIQYGERSPTTEGKPCQYIAAYHGRFVIGHRLGLGLGVQVPNSGVGGCARAVLVSMSHVTMSTGPAIMSASRCAS